MSAGFRGPTKSELEAALQRMEIHLAAVIVDDDTLTAWRIIRLALKLGVQPEEYAAVGDLAQAMVYMAASKDAAERALESTGSAMSRIEARKRRNSEKILAVGGTGTIKPPGDEGSHEP
jgi:plasmid maintenance system antidote protein VapI